MEGVTRSTILFSFLTSSSLQEKGLLPTAVRSIHPCKCKASYHPLAITPLVQAQGGSSLRLSSPAEALHPYLKLKSLPEGPARGGERPRGVGQGLAAPPLHLPSSQDAGEEDVLRETEKGERGGVS